MILETLTAVQKSKIDTHCDIIAASSLLITSLFSKCASHQVLTVEEMMPHLQEVSGTVTKNLFLKDKKKKGLWLVSARHDRQVSSRLDRTGPAWAACPTNPMILSVALQVNLNDLAKKLGVGSGNMRFADEAAMLEKLKVGTGSVQKDPEQTGCGALT